MKKHLPKAQKGKIIKTVKSVSKKVPKVKIPKPKLPSRTVTKGRSGKLYETDSYAKEGLKQAIETRNAAAGDFTAIDRMLKKPTITDQDKLDLFKQALENNPKIKLYRRGGNVYNAKQFRRSKKH